MEDLDYLEDKCKASVGGLQSAQGYSAAVSKSYSQEYAFSLPVEAVHSRGKGSSHKESPDELCGQTAQVRTL